ncbi:hypothetical protein RSAG8_12479, partial [Rhizoctonia solani AG-8 WAC10335]
MPPRRLSVSVEIPIPPKSPHKPQENDGRPPASKNKDTGMPPPGKKRKRTHVRDEDEPPIHKTRQSSRPPASTGSTREPSVPRSTRDPSVPRSTRAPSVPRSTRAPSVARSTRAASVARSVRGSSVPRSRAGSVPRSPRTPRKLPPVKKLPFNPLPTAPAPTRPAMRLFVFGNGDMGQFGLGTGVLGDISRPRQHTWFKEAIETGILGTGPGAGVDALCAGGMHTLIVDEVGKVWSWGINDNAALGRPTVDVTHPDRPNEVIEAEILETEPMVVQVRLGVRHNGPKFNAIVKCGDENEIKMIMRPVG